MKNKRKVITLTLLLAVIALVGVFLYLKTLDRGALEESQDSASRTQEKDPIQKETTKLQDVEAEPEPETEEKAFRVKVGQEEFPVIFEDGDYENLNKARLIWTVNNLFKSGHDFEVAPTDSYKLYIDGREVETNFYLMKSGRGYRPKIRASYNSIVKEDGVNHLVLTRKFIEAYIEASKYEAITSELNTFIDRLNRIKSAELDKLTETEIDSMLFIDPSLRDEIVGVEEKRKELRQFAVDKHFQSTNVFWVAESIGLGRYLYGEDTKTVFGGNAIYYRREGNLPWWFSDDPADYDALPPPSNFDPRLHTDPDAEPFIWVPAGTWEFINEDRQWKVLILRPGT